MLDCAEALEHLKKEIKKKKKRERDNESFAAGRRKKEREKERGLRVKIKRNMWTLRSLTNTYLQKGG
jgi:hypothetical protein